MTDWQQVEHVKQIERLRVAYIIHVTISEHNNVETMLSFYDNQYHVKTYSHGDTPLYAHATSLFNAIALYDQHIKDYHK